MYEYRYFIPENTAPNGAEKIGVYDSKGNRVCGVSLGRLTQTKKTKLYSFCAISDVHITYNTANTDFQRALTYAENNCAFTCICGDLTSSGDDSQLAEYKSIVDAYAITKPVYSMGGNHETYLSDMVFDRLTPYTGYPMYYSVGISSNGSKIAQDVTHTPVAYGSDVKDVYIFLSFYGQSWKPEHFVNTDQLQWLYETLEANRNKRCLIFNHVYPYNDGVGDAKRIHGGNCWDTEDGSVGQALINLLKHYENAILFHGHSHLRFYLQELDEKANYSQRAGYRSVHIPSLSVPRDKVDETLAYIYAESEGYIVDVYADCIVLNGRDFIDNDADGHIIPIATYKIDTKLVNVEAGTFVDSTGTITV